MTSFDYNYQNALRQAIVFSKIVCEELLVRDTNLHNKVCSEMHSGSCMTSSCIWSIYRVAFCLCFKVRPSAKPFIWKISFIQMQTLVHLHVNVLCRIDSCRTAPHVVKPDYSTSAYTKPVNVHLRALWLATQAPKWRRWAVYIYQALKWWGKYPPLFTDTEVNNNNSSLIAGYSLVWYILTVDISSKFEKYPVLFTSTLVNMLTRCRL